MTHSPKSMEEKARMNDALDREMAERNGMTVERYRELLNKKLYQKSELEKGQ